MNETHHVHYTDDGINDSNNFTQLLTETYIWK